MLQEYVGRQASELGVRVAVVRHAAASVTAEEKARVLGWPLERVVKAVYASDGDHMVGFIAPASYGMLPVREVVREEFGLSSRAAKRFLISVPPPGMMYGTCTPFVQEELVGRAVQRVFIADEPLLYDAVVDVGIGGTDLCVSAQLSYGGMQAILERHFGSYVKRFGKLVAA